MSLMSPKQLLEHATGHDCGVCALSISNTEQGLAVMNAASACESPVILQANLKTHNTSVGGRMIVLFAPVFAYMNPGTPICLNQYHGHKERVRVRVTEANFTAAMTNESLPVYDKITASNDCSVGIIFRVGEVAKWIGTSIEGEPVILGLPETGEAGDEEEVELNGSLAPKVATA